jgi:hypothetical protein
LLFYAPGTSVWLKDSIGRGFRYQKNLYSDTAYYYINIGSVPGKRIPVGASGGVAASTVTTYDARLAHERDLVNLINSGKQWYGESWQAAQSGPAIQVNWPGLVQQEPLRINSAFASRNVGAIARFNVGIATQQGRVEQVPAITGTFLDRYATAVERKDTLSVGSNNFAVGFTYTSTAQGATCWLDKLEILGRRRLELQADTLLSFRDWRSVQHGIAVQFDISTSLTGAMVWEVTDPLQPRDMGANLSNGRLSFTNDASRLREYIAFHLPHARTQIFAMGRVTNQDLHGMAAVQYLILTPAAFRTAAERLADFHRNKYGYTVAVVNTEQVYHEFGSGSPDPAAIRDWVKMFYDRAGTDSTKRPRYLLLFGSGSFDPQQRTNNNYRFIPTFQTQQSLDPLSSYTSDDFFSLLDDNEDINIPNAPFTSDIAIGRLPARTLTEAQQFVSKIIRYHQTGGLGEWRNQLVFLADDRDNNLHLNDTEAITGMLQTVNPGFLSRKLYLDAFPLQSGAGGARYPAVSEEVVNSINRGALIFNYSGHGNHVRLADEAVVTLNEVNRFRNPDRLPLVITASCDFYPFDDPSKIALGAQMLTADSNGAIALLTTSRLVFASSNRVINEFFLTTALQPQAGGKYLTIGEAARRARNLSIVQAGEVLNTRKFVLLGDPAMQLAFPNHTIRITAVNGRQHGTADTLKGNSTYTITGEIVDGNGNRVTDFNGRLIPSVYDQPRITQTLGNAAGSVVTNFKQNTSLLFKGNVTVSNGSFVFSFSVPRDVAFQPGRGMISGYAFSASTDAAGVDTGFIMQGNPIPPVDQQGPQIRLYLNDTLFRDGGLTHEYPILLAGLFDTSGINTSGNGIGHDLTLTIDGNVRDTRVLNEFYQSDLDNYRSGWLRYPLPLQDTGHHVLELKAWDGANNSSLAQLHYIVVREEKLQINRWLNFPNPFTDRTRFSFEHNVNDRPLKVTLFLYQSNGRLVKRIQQQVHSQGTRNIEISWDGRDESGRKMQKGVYIYRMEISAGSQPVIKAGQLILL